jgi:hypothetical protein
MSEVAEKPEKQDVVPRQIRFGRRGWHRGRLGMGNVPSTCYGLKPKMEAENILNRLR